MKKLFSKLKKPKVFRTIATIVCVVIVVTGILYFEKTKDRIFIDDSLVSSPIINIVPAVPGKLYDTNVYENEEIKKGDQIAVIGTQILRADTNGLIIMANTQTGSILTSQTPVAQMIDHAQMRIAGTIDENKGLSDVKAGQVASFTIDAIPGKTFWGYVDEISPSAKQTQLSFSISSERPTQQFVVYVKFNSAQYPQIKNGMSAKITVFTKN